MKELDDFTVERLTELSTRENLPEVAALARIALAAKRAEQMLNYPVIPDGWKLVPVELIEVMAEVIRISDRDHETWNRAKKLLQPAAAPGGSAPTTKISCWSCKKKHDNFTAYE